MHRVTRLFVMMAMAALATTSAAAQDEVDEAFLPLAAVMEHRAIIGDGTPFSACALYESLGRPDALLDRLGSMIQYLDHQDLQSCHESRDLDPVTAEPAECAFRLIDVQEYLVGASNSLIVLRVGPGDSELSYSEDYRLRRIDGGERWRVEDVRLHSWAHVLRRDLCAGQTPLSWNTFVPSGKRGRASTLRTGP